MEQLPEFSLGLAGTAKNTGKTTTTATLIHDLRLRGISFYLTSIGYDGENIDNITGLPKPKLRLEAGDIIATAEKCIEASTAQLKRLAQTDIFTPLGRVWIVKVEKAGLVVTAGPNKSSEVRKLDSLFREFGPGIRLFDGALNRIAPMAETEAFILATGAAKMPDIPGLARETELISQIANLPAIPDSSELNARNLKNVTLLSPDRAVLYEWPKSSLLTAADAAPLYSGGDLPTKAYLYIPGIISLAALECCLPLLHKANIRLVFHDPVKLLVSGDAALFELLIKLPEHGGFVGVIRRVPLLAVTVNPFYSEYRYETKTYQPAFVDALRLQVAVQRAVTVPVVNVIKQGGGRIADLVLTSARTGEGAGILRFE